MARDHINIRAGFDLASFSSSAQNLERELRATGQRLTRIGRNMSLAFSLPTLGAGVFATKEFAEFEQAMAKVNAVSGATAQEFDMLTTMAEELGRTTRYTAKEVAGLELSYAKLGFSADEIEKITEATLNLALATDEDLANSAMVAGNTLRGFALDASEMGRVVDVMAKSFTSSALDLEKWSVSTSKTASIAATLGFTLEEVAAMQSVLADTGIEASIIGTSLRKIFTTLAAKGITYKDAMEQIAGSQSKVNTAVGLFDVRAANAAVILSQATDKVNRLTDAYENSTGAAKEMGDIMNETLQMSMIRLKSAVEGLAIKFGEVIAPAVRKVAEFLAKLTQKFAELSPETKRLIVILGGLVAVIPPIVLGIGAITTALAFLVANPIALAITGFATLATALGIYTIVTDKAGKATNKLSVEQSALKKTTDAYNFSMKLEKDGLDTLFGAIKKAKNGTEERQKLIDIANKTYGTTLKNIKDEAKFLGQLESAYQDVAKSIEQKIALQTKERELQPLIERELDLTEKLRGLRDRAGLGGEGDLQLSLDADIAPSEAFAQSLRNGGNEARFLFNEISKLEQALLEVQKAKLKVIDLGFKSLFDFKSPDELGGGDDGAELKSAIKEMESAAKEFRDKQKQIYDSISRTSGIIHPFVNALLGDKTFVTKTINERLAEYKTQFIKAAGEIAQGIEGIVITSKNKLTDLTLTLNDAIQDGLRQMVYDMADMFGQMLTDDAFTGKEFGKGILDMVATFMQRLGGLMIVWGLNFEAFEKSIKSGNGVLAVVAGAAMVAAGAAIKGALNNGLESASTSVSAPSYASNSASYGGYEVESVIHLQGREMIIVQGRENSFRR